MKYPWGTERRLNAYSDYFKKQFGERVQKITINAGFTCPNRDGSIGRGGCTFCDNSAFNPSYNEASKPVRQQLDEGIAFHRVRYRKVTKFLAYFQAFTNTYAPVEVLKEIYQPALDHPDVVGIIIGTRPDVVDDEKLDYLAELSHERYLVIEYGIESVYKRTLERVNRGHTFEQTVNAIEATASRGIRTGGHMIIGLPGESKSDWLQAAKIVSGLPLNNIKFHQLQLIKGTAMARDYIENSQNFTSFSMEEYLEIMLEILEVLNPAFVVERIAGEVTPGAALTEGWGVRYDQVLRRFEAMLAERDTWQGRLWKGGEV